MSTTSTLTAELDFFWSDAEGDIAPHVTLKVGTAEVDTWIVQVDERVYLASGNGIDAARTRDEFAAKKIAALLSRQEA